MKVIFSRKGFDSGAGGGPSPIIDGKPISLPIPTTHRSDTTYNDIGLGNLVKMMTKGKLSGTSLCHHDPMFEDGRCAFGQTGKAQTHLRNQGVGVGDIFLFFGLFANADRTDKHHRFFGFLDVETVVLLGAQPGKNDQPDGFSRRHPHTIGTWEANNTLYIGKGGIAQCASDDLRLSLPGEKVSQWRVPQWLGTAGLSYHDNPDRWSGHDRLSIVARGQEFVTDITGMPEAVTWVESVKSAILQRSLQENFVYV